MNEAANDPVGKRTAPYVAFASFKTFLSNLREDGGVPIIIDNSVFGNVSGSLRSQLKGALKFFGMIDEAGKPSDVMRQAVAATADQGSWRTTVDELLRASYAPILAHPLTNTTTTALQKEFQLNYGGSTDVIEKAITFFVGAAKEAGVPLSPRLTERQKPQRRATRRRSTDVPPGPPEGAESQAPRAAPATDAPAPLRTRKVNEHQVALIEIINTYTEMSAEMRSALLDAVGFIATKGVVT